MPNILMLVPTAKSFLSRNVHENPTFRSPKSLTCQYPFERKANVSNLILDRLANSRDSAVGRKALELQGIMARYDPIG